MAIVLQNTRTNSGLRGATFANNSALDNFRRSLQGLNSGLQKIDDRRDQQATDTFQNRLAGLSLNELENFNVNNAAQGSRLNAVTLRDMLKQRTADERAEQEALFQRQQIQAARNNAPILNTLNSEVNALLAKGGSQEDAQRLIANTLKNNPDASPGLRNSINKIGLDLNNDLRKQAQSRLLFNQNQEDRANRLARQNIIQQREDEKYANYQNSLIDNQINDIFIGKTINENQDKGLNGILDTIRKDPYYNEVVNNEGVTAANALLDAARNAYNNNNKELLSGNQREIDLGKQQIENQQAQELTQLANNESQRNLYQENKKFVAQNTDNRTDTTIYGRGGDDLQSDLDRYYNNGLTVDGITISKEDLDQRAVNNALNNYFDKDAGFFGFDEGVRDTKSFERAIALGSLETKRNKIQEQILREKFAAQSRNLERGQVPEYLDDRASEALSRLNTKINNIEEQINKINNTNN